MLCPGGAEIAKAGVTDFNDVESERYILSLYSSKCQDR